MSERSQPRVATYRLQLRAGFTFDEACALVPYLAELGVSHLYLSPIQRAAPQSTHGYDVTDPNRVDEALGGDAGRTRLLQTLGEHGMSLMLDIVPNHMSVASEENLWWQDVLENGPFSAYARAFDVEWDRPDDEASNQVLLPILGDHYGRALEAGQFMIERHADGFFLNVTGRRLPLSASSLADLLLPAASAVHSPELELTLKSLAAVGEERAPERRRQHLDVLKKQLLDLCVTRPEVEAAINVRLASVNADVIALDALISAQFYRLAHHRIARYDLDYRRFFDINDLAALSMHRAEVFEQSHALVKRWVASGEVDALRIDHPDGLRDPAGYFQRLRSDAPDTWLVAEKILAPKETLPSDWPVQGTTGYDFLGAANALFVDPRAEAPLTELYSSFVGPGAISDFASEAIASKRLVLDDLLAADLWRLTRLFQRICASTRRHRDFAKEELRVALREVLACLPVYRCYVQPNARYRERDVRSVRYALERAHAERPELDGELLGLVEELLNGGCISELEWEFVGRFQQVSAATTAKGVEDTAFYRYTRLLSLDEVGASPALFGSGPERFHEFCTALSAQWPYSLVATTTHDTKRSEDARLRISALSEFTQEWAEAVQRWSALARQTLSSEPPDRATEYALWQTLIAAHPISEQRLSAYLEKAMREAKVQSSWALPNPDYEARVQNFARGVLDRADLMHEVAAFVERISPVAQRSSLSQTLLKLSACGVPDIYQGSEVWDTHLTDPDNRGRVDFDELRRALERATRASVPEAMAGMAQGLTKLWLIQRVLGLRRLKPEWFGPKADYRPLQAQGTHAERVVAFARGEPVVVVAPRLWRELLERGFADTELSLPPGSYRNLFESDARYSGRVQLGRLLEHFPVALLLHEKSS